MERIVRKYKLEVAREGEDDERYFVENPSRNHRVRPAFPKEEQQLREISKVHPYWTELPPDRQVMILVKQVMPDIRFKKPALIPAGWFPTAGDLVLAGEEVARNLYDTWGPDLGSFWVT